MESNLGYNFLAFVLYVHWFKPALLIEEPYGTFQILNFRKPSRMTKTEATTVKDAVHKLQLCLLDGIQDENKLFAAGSLMCRSDYQDIVTERTIVNMCGYPLCSNLLPSDRPHKGRYRISLREHKVYDLCETYMYCSTNCVVNSRAFAGSLPEERSSTFNPSKLNEVLRLFEGPSLDSEVDLGRKGELGLSGLKIQEKWQVKSGEVSLEEWIGPSNAIEGYVPQMEKTIKPPQSKILKKGTCHDIKTDIAYNLIRIFVYH